MLPTINESDINRIAEIVRQDTGNVVSQKNFAMIESRMRTLLVKMQLTSMEQYWDYYKKNEMAEREVLKGIFTTHYTFFFREFIHFEILLNWISENIDFLKKRYQSQQIPLKVWSAAASRGQEIYSLATYLEVHLKQKHGIPFQILGTDIDTESIKYANNGVYPIKEVNTIPATYLEPFWKRGQNNLKDFAAIKPEVKKNVSFQNLNLKDLSTWQNQDLFDVIFCRNVFIYFSEEDVKKIALKMANKLSNIGLFVTGVSEALRFPEWQLKSIGPSSYVKSAAEKKTSPEIQKSVSSEPAKYRVLCVDDSPTIRAIMKKIFGSDPDCALVDTCNNGREAREKLDKNNYDVMTLDIHMPEVSGIDFLEKYYRANQDPPVIIISSVNRTDADLATKAISLGASDYVEKPELNNIQKSTNEILSKAKMVMTKKKSAVPNDPPKVGSFDASISQKIVVPDASQCLRIVIGSGRSIRQVEQVVRGQEKEARSPALVIVDVQNSADQLVIQLPHWGITKYKMFENQDKILKPGHFYLSNISDIETLLPLMSGKSVSLQILEQSSLSRLKLMQAKKWQILLMEDIASLSHQFENELGLKMSDITPATSFASLSVEFFANLRKSAA